MIEIEILLSIIMSSNSFRADRLYSPRKAWMQALLYFSVCLLLSWFSGVLPGLLQEPLVADTQLIDPVWWLATAVVTAHVLFAYIYYWPRGTITHGRQLRPLSVFLFGSLWGFCQGQLVLVLYGLIERLQLGTIWQVVIMFGVYANLTAVWHSRYWDIHVAPDHNIYEWNLRKVLVAHSPFLLLSITHYAIYGNALIFVLWQIIALLASTWAMRFPAPGDPETPSHNGQGVRLASLSTQQTGIQ